MPPCTDCGRYCCDCCYTSAEMERMGFFWKPPAFVDEEEEEIEELDLIDLMLLQFPEMWDSLEAYWDIVTYGAD